MIAAVSELQKVFEVDFFGGRPGTTLEVGLVVGRGIVGHFGHEAGVFLKEIIGEQFFLEVSQLLLLVARGKFHPLNEIIIN